MMRKKSASLIGVLWALFILSSSAEAGWLDKLNEWLDSFNRENDARQLRFYAAENCKKYFEKGELERAKPFCVTAVEENRDLIYYAAVTEYKYGNENRARGYLEKAEKYLLERLELGRGDEQSRIEDKKRLANVYLWLGEIYKKVYEKQRGDFAAAFGREAMEAAEGYCKKAMALTEE